MTELKFYDECETTKRQLDIRVLFQNVLNEDTEINIFI